MSRRTPNIPLSAANAAKLKLRIQHVTCIRDHPYSNTPMSFVLDLIITLCLNWFVSWGNTAMIISKKEKLWKAWQERGKKEDFLVLFDQGENERELELIVPILQKLEQLASLPCSRSLTILLLLSPISQPVNTLISWQVFPPKKKQKKRPAGCSLIQTG